jgi:non-ribosomal peptide synthetase component F
MRKEHDGAEPVILGTEPTGAAARLGGTEGMDMASTKTSAAIEPITADLGAILGRAARRFGPKPAVIAEERTVTYEELDRLCDQAAAGLHHLGVAPGDRVSLYPPNRWE